MMTFFFFCLFVYLTLSSPRLILTTGASRLKLALGLAYHAASYGYNGGINFVHHIDPPATRVRPFTLLAE